MLLAKFAKIGCTRKIGVLQYTHPLTSTVTQQMQDIQTQLETLGGHAPTRPTGRPIAANRWKKKANGERGKMRE